jgi:hypothetical protein
MKLDIKMLISLMREASQMNHLSGSEKKDYVMKKLKNAIPLDNEIEELLLDIIDTLIDVEKGRLVLNPVVKTTCTGCVGFFC